MSQVLSNRALTHVTLTVLCFFSSISVPAKAMGQCLHEKEQCCDEWTEKAVWMIGGALLGGGIGYLAADHSKKHGHHGASGSQGSTGIPGPQGPTGPEYVADLGEALNFSISIDTAMFFSTDPGNYSFIPFVVTPNGQTIEGLPVNIHSSNIVDLVLDGIDISNPLFGDYQVGLMLVKNSDFTLNYYQISIRAVIRASRDDSHTTTERNYYSNQNIVGDYQQIQAISNFTYSPLNIP